VSRYRRWNQLLDQQMLAGIRGGAVAQRVTYDLPLRYKSERRSSEKRRIAEVAGAMTQHEGEAVLARFAAAGAQVMTS
jgi:DeoR family transcriptional regulator, aga operon transcriptional repressor